MSWNGFVNQNCCSTASLFGVDVIMAKYGIVIEGNFVVRAEVCLLKTDYERVEMGDEIL